MIVVVAVIAIVSAMALSGYSAVQLRTRFNGVSGQFLADVANARERARADEQPVVVMILRSSAGTTADRYMVLEDAAHSFVLNSFNPSSIPSADTVIADVSFVKGEVGYGPSTGYPGGALLAPFQSVVVTNRCSFLGSTGGTAPYDQRGAITFQTDGRATFSDSSSSGSVTIQDTSTTTTRLMTLAIIGPTGAVRSFTQ